MRDKIPRCGIKVNSQFMQQKPGLMIECEERVFFCGIPSPRVENPVVRSSQAMLETVTRTLSASKEAWTEGSSVLDQLDSIEVRIKQHMQGNRRRC